MPPLPEGFEYGRSVEGGAVGEMGRKCCSNRKSEEQVGAGVLVEEQGPGAVYSNADRRCSVVQVQCQLV